MNKKVFRIIRPVGLRPIPNEFEETIAELCAEYFHSDVEYVIRNNHTTPDIKVIKTRQYWEIKNICGSGKHTIEDNLRKASKQSPNVIISLLRSSADTQRTIMKIKNILKTKRMPIKRVLLVTKLKTIIDIK